MPLLQCSRGFTLSLYAEIVVEAPVTKAYCYRVPSALIGMVQVGSSVVVPFGRRSIRGFCVAVSDSCEIDEKRIKEIISVGGIDERAPDEILSLSQWVSQYYHSSWGMSLAAAVPGAVRKGTRGRSDVHVRLTVALDRLEEECAALQKRAPRQAAVLQYLYERFSKEQSPDASIAAVEIEEACSVTRSALKGLEKKKLVILSMMPVHSELSVVSEKQKVVRLTAEQDECCKAVNAALTAGSFRAFLLHGVTGSGKTEVYLQAMDTALRLGRGVLVMVPEISLTPQTVARFRHRAGEVAVLHSNMADGQRADVWRKLRHGHVQVVVGPRSAVFAPVPNLGLIIVDEEHVHSFKQENDPRYHGRDVAVVRARSAGAVVLMGSATPSLESWNNAMLGKYSMLRLSQRVGGASLPEATVVNMREEWSDCKQMVVFSRLLLQRLRDALTRREQAILLLNRRGFNTVITCLSCGNVIKCRSCDISLTHHRKQNLLRCHYCDYTACVPETCPACGAHTLRRRGAGTERAEDVLTRIMPEARIVRMDSDTMGGRDAHGRTLAAFARGEYDVLLGTQMVAKGFDFPNVTMVGVLSADSSLAMPDFRAAERTFQLIAQVIGRAGRADKKGSAVIQALDPDHYAITCAIKQDFHAFAAREMADRKALGYPPFGRLARILVRDKRSDRAGQIIREAAEILQRNMPPSVTLLGPAPCPIEKINDYSRHHLLLKAGTHRDIARALLAIQACLTARRNTHISVDVDPVSLL